MIELILIGAVCCALAGVVVSVARRRRRRGVQKAKVSFEIEKEILDQMKRWADHNGITLSQLIRTALRKFVPVDSDGRIASAVAVLANQEEAFKKLDEEDRLMGIASTGEESLNDAAQVPEVKVHSCQYLEPGAPANFRPQECQGICSHQAHKGKVCQWPSLVATKCDSYSPRIVRVG